MNSKRVGVTAVSRKVIERPSLTRQAGRRSVLALSGPPGGRRPHAHSQTTWIKPSQARGGSTLSGGRLPREGKRTMEKTAQRWYSDLAMARAGKKLLHEALELPIEERAELAAELIASLDGPADADVEAAWAAEIERRAARALSGESQGTAWEEVRDRIKREISGR